MYQVIKSLNNNGIVARCLETQEEYIFIGKGIGFSRKTEDTFESIPEAKIYKLQESIQKNDDLGILNNVDPVYLDIANDIILLAEKRFGNFDSSILLSLADHIAFSIERQKNGLVLSNPLHLDIRILFAEEYEVAKEAVAVIEKYVGIVISEEEVAYIAMHIHAALTKEHIHLSMSIVLLVEKFIKELESRYEFTIDQDSLSYSRLLTHIKYMIIRAYKKEALHVDITPYIKSEFPKSYKVAEDLCKSLGEDIQCEFQETEISYLAVHIERLQKRDKKQNSVD